MHTPLNISPKEISQSNKLFKKTLNHMMRNKCDRDSLYNHDKFKVFLMDVLGFKSSEKIYTYMVFRHFCLMKDIDELVKKT